MSRQSFCTAFHALKTSSGADTDLDWEPCLPQVRGESPDGLTVGVTTQMPTQTEAAPPTAEHVPFTWAVGYDGQMWDAATGMLSPVGWDPRSLEAGDVVGVLVTSHEGELIVFRNGKAGPGVGFDCAWGSTSRATTRVAAT